MGFGLGSCVTDHLMTSLPAPTAIITTNAFCTRPRGNGSPTSSTSTNWCWLITLSSMWGWLVSTRAGRHGLGGEGVSPCPGWARGFDTTSPLSCQGVRCPRAPLQCPRAAATSVSLLQHPLKCCPPLRTPAHLQPALHPHPPSSRLWWPGAWAEARSVTVAMALQSWRSHWERTFGPDHQVLRSWVPSEGPRWLACPTTLASSVSTPGPGVALNP